MSKSVNQIAGTAAAVAMMSFGAPAVAETVQIICNVERTLAGAGERNRPNDRLVWRFSVDPDAPSVIWTGRSGPMNDPTGGRWLLGQAATAIREGNGELTACLIDTGVCGETISTDYYDETVTAVSFSPDLRRVRMMTTHRYANGQRDSEFFSGACS